MRTSLRRVYEMKEDRLALPSNTVDFYKPVEVAVQKPRRVIGKPAAKRMRRRSPEAKASKNSENISDNFIALKEVSKSYGTHHVLRTINLTVNTGNVLAIIGPSGSGKSTLLRCINFIEPPDSGSVKVGDITIDTYGSTPAKSEVHRLRAQIGMVFQSFNLFPHMTVLRNITLAQERVLKRSRGEAQDVAMQLLKRVGLEDKAQQYPSRCSGGQQQRIAIARALALEPKVMLFDEPTSALDPELGLEVLAVMRELASSGMTMIVVTHEMGFAENVSDHTLIMADGRIIEYGPSREIIRSPQTERAKKFLGAVSGR